VLEPFIFPLIFRLLFLSAIVRNYADNKMPRAHASVTINLSEGLKRV